MFGQSLQEGLIAELKEADRIISLCHVGAGLVAYTLSNCTVGVYHSLQRSWRVKSKHAVNCICAHDPSKDSPSYLISGWGNGKVCDLRSLWSAGHLHWRAGPSSHVINMHLVARYTMLGLLWNVGRQ